MLLKPRFLACLLFACGTPETTPSMLETTPPPDAAPLPPPADAPAADAPGAVDARPGAAALAVDPSSWDFGAVVLGRSGAAAAFTVENRGSAASAALAPAVAGARAAAFVVDAGCAGAELPPGGRCVVTVGFRPDALGAISATLVVGDLHVALAGAGIAPGQLGIAPGSADLGAVAAGAAGAPVDFTVTNGGGAATGALTVALAGAGFDVTADGCSGRKLDAGASCTIAVALAPAAAGALGASLEVSADPGGAASATLTGRGLAGAELSVAPAALDLGTVVVGGKARGALTVANGGGVATGTLAARLDGDELTVASDGCSGTSLDAGASCIVRVEARPSSAGAKSAMFSVGDGVLAASAPVTAAAVPPGALAVAPAEQEYAAALVGAPGERHDFKVRNSGGTETGPLAIALSGTGADQFAIVADGCSGAKLPPATDCALAVQLVPSARGGHSAALVATASPGGTAASALTGAGLAPAAIAGDVATLAFGTVDVGAAAAAQTWTLRNAGDVASGPLALATDGDAADFTVTDGCGTAPLDPGATCTIDVALAPRTAGAKSLTLALGGASLEASGTARPPSPLAVTVAGGGSVASTPDGIQCGASCAASYRYGTTVTLTATPDEGWTFMGWSGACSGASACLVAMTAPQVVTATFVRVKVALTTNVTGAGTVTPDGGAACASSCTSSYDYGTTVKLVAAPQPGAGFAGWTGCPNVDNFTCTVTLTKATSVTAGFLPLSIGLDATVTGPGTVGSTPGALVCSAGTCSAVFAYGSSVKLTATPAANAHFTGWSGACSGTAPTCTLTMGLDPVAVGAAFAADTVDLALTPGAGGTIDASPAGASCGAGCLRYTYGQSVTLTPKPAAGYTFVAWSGDCSGDKGCSVVMDRGRAVGASFVQRFVLTVGTPTGGTVTGPGGIQCGAGGSACTATFDAGTSVTLTATEDPGFRLGIWNGCSASGKSCTLTIAGTASASVSFVRQAKLTVSPEANGTVIGPGGLSCGAACSATFDVGTQVTLTALPDAGYRAGDWTGCTANADGTCTATLDADRTVVPSFVKQVKLTWSVGPGGGVLKPSAGVPCPGSCVVVDAGAKLTLAATPDAGATVGAWGGLCAATPAGQAGCTLTMPGSDASASVTFQYALNVSITGSGTVSGGGVSCSSSCTKHLDYSTTPLPLSVVPAPGWTLKAMDCGGADPSTCSVTMNHDANVKVEFAQPTVTLTVVDSKGGSVGVLGPNPPYHPGTMLTITATGANGWTFGNWRVNGVDDKALPNPLPLTLNADATLQAIFRAPALALNDKGVSTGGAFNLTGIFGSTSLGDVSVAYQCVAGNCPSAWGFDVGTSIGVGAAPDAGKHVSGWLGIGSVVPATVPEFTIDLFGTPAQSVTWCAAAAGGLCLDWQSKAMPYGPGADGVGVKLASDIP